MDHLPPRLLFQVLGPLQLTVDGRCVPLRGTRLQTTLGLLLSQPNKAVSDSHLIDGLWPENPPPSAAANLRAYIRSLRQLLGDPQRVARMSRGYLLRAEPHEIDVLHFAELTAQSDHFIEQGDIRRAADLLRQALDKWSGPAYSGLHASGPLRTEAAVLEEQRFRSAHRWVELEIKLGHHAEMIPILLQLIEDFPLREKLRAQLMEALYRADRQAEALEVYRETRALFIESLGIEPGQELRELEQLVLRGGSLAEAEPAEPVVTSPPRNIVPADTADFTGRDKEVALLSEWLTGSPGGTPPIVVVSARGGAGKTTLAVHMANRLRNRFPDGQIYVHLRGAETTHRTMPEVALASMLRALGVPDTRIPENHDERGGMLRAILSDRRVLLIIDDAGDESQVMPLIPGMGGCAMLVTSRRRLTAIPGARLLELEPFTEDQALRFLRHMVGSNRMDADSKASLALTRLCGRHPLALRIAGARLAARPHWSLARMVSRLTDEHRRFDELVHGELDVRANLMVSYRALQPRARLLLMLLGALDAVDLEEWVAVTLLDSSFLEAEDLLDQLVDSHLVNTATTPSGRVRYSLHDLIRIFARERAQQELAPDDLREALQRAFGALLTVTEHAHTLLAGRDHLVVHSNAPRWEVGPEVLDDIVTDPVAWCETELTNISAAVQQTAALGLDELCWDIAVTAAPLLEVRRHLDEWQHMHEIALATVRAAGNPRGEAVILTELGELSLGLHDHRRAVDFLEDAARILTGLQDRHAHALAQLKLAALDRLGGRLDMALRRAQDSVTVLNDLGDLGNQALALRQIGQIHTQLGEHCRAREHFERALSAAEQAGASRLVQQINYRLGELDVECERPQASVPRFEAVLDFCRSIGDRVGMAYAFYGLGRAQAAMGRLQESGQTLALALTHAEDTNERIVEAEIHQYLGKLAHARGRAAEAAGQFHIAGVIFRELGVVPRKDDAFP
ncbi:BTAD domain-containing putative transcriptional regulator [Streptosporangium sp. NPDC020145]|uniref:BTAD domain-containing putative transcriptional regulator n=1 Tax=Streptosporangium jomthongense TaxID=1193683 RepID=A0ABV8ES56_9ACTN